MVSRVSADEIDDFITQKGREYFEKIIQFGVRVPSRTPEQAHRYVAAQFPQWQPATDIIQTAIGTNPRRLKQYCNLLTYKRLVGDIPLSMSDQKESDEYLPTVATNLLEPQLDAPAAQPPPLDVSPELYQRLLEVVEECYMESIPDLQGLFLDARIRLWRNAIPFGEYRKDATALLRVIIETLMDDFNDQGESALLLFLTILKEKAPQNSPCQFTMGSLIKELTNNQEGEADDA